MRMNSTSAYQEMMINSKHCSEVRPPAGQSSEGQLPQRPLLCV